mgnify:FL=1
MERFSFLLLRIAPWPDVSAPLTAWGTDPRAATGWPVLAACAPPIARSS